MKLHLHGEVIPYFDVKGGDWRFDRDLEGLVFDKEGNATKQQYDSISKTLNDEGSYVHYADEADTEAGLFNSIFIKPLEKYDELDESIVLIAAYQTFDSSIHVMAYYDIDIKEFNMNKFNEEMKRVHGVENIAIAIPSFELRWIQIQGIANVNEEELKAVYVTMGLKNMDDGDIYLEQLTQLGWSINEELNIHVDPTNTVGADIYLEEDADNTYILNINIYKISDLLM